MGMNRSDLQQLASIRIHEAKILLDNECYEGAYYLTGYALECALKACIAKNTKEYDFPDKDLVRRVFTHDLEELSKLAGLETERREKLKSKDFARNWSIVKDWSEQYRYEVSVGAAKAKELYDAVVDNTNGVLEWLKKSW